MIVNNKKLGAIKVRIFSVILLAVSCILAISASKSLFREFKGIVFEKKESGFSDYDLLLMPETYLSRRDAFNHLANPEVESKLRIVGVSEVVYSQADIFSTISKSKLSIFIWVNDTWFFDKGLFWYIWSAFCAVLAFIIYAQTLKPRNTPKYQENEELEIP